MNEEDFWEELIRKDEAADMYSRVSGKFEYLYGGCFMLGWENLLGLKENEPVV